MPVPQQREAVERHLLRDTAYAALRDAIVTGTLSPGEVLHDTDLCGWLALSRTPVRDALARLRDDGLVEMAPQRYTRVAPLRRRDVHDLFPVLAGMHALATELAVPRLRPGHVAALQRENEDFVAGLRAGDAERAYGADERFHDVFVAASENREIGRLLARLAPALRRFERLVGGALPGRRSVAQHQAIVSRAQVGEAAAAASAVRENWLTLGALIDRALATPPRPAAGC
jgi:DNA-binding GntR family transcriptional regulator